jgi:hypothetical protein
LGERERERGEREKERERGEREKEREREFLHTKAILSYSYLKKGLLRRMHIIFVTYVRAHSDVHSRIDA